MVYSKPNDTGCQKRGHNAVNAKVVVTLNKGINMRNILFVIVSATLLAGCSQNEDPVSAETEKATAASEAQATEADSSAASSTASASATQATEPESGASSAPDAETVTSSESPQASSDNQETPAPASFISATVNKKVSIRAEASSNGDTVATLEKGATVTVGSRNGIWYAAQSPTEGWIKMSDVTIPNNGDGSSVLAGFFSGRMGSGNSVASTGARGLTSEDVVTSTPDFEAVKELNALQNSGDSLGDDFFDDQEERNITDSNG